jgi:phage shock protein E
MVIVLVLGLIVFFLASRSRAELLGSDLRALISGGALIVDVRTPAEFAGGHVKGAVNVPHDQVTARLEAFGADKNRQIVVYCRSGRRSGLAQAALSAAGYTRVVNGGTVEDVKKASQP